MKSWKSQLFSLCISFWLIVGMSSHPARANTQLPGMVVLCSELLKDTELKISQSTRPAVILEDGTIEYSVYSGYRERKMWLPSVVHLLRQMPEEKVVIVTPGNTLYDGTHHNLGFHFSDHIVKNHGYFGVGREAEAKGEYPRSERIEITYDDDTARSGEMTFYSEKGLFRTQSGEIFLKRLEDGRLAILVRAIGDYNETGDFVIPLVDALSLSSKDIVVVQDNLRVDKLKIEVDPLGPVDSKGNNAIFSLNRSLALALLPSLERVVRGDQVFGSSITDLDWTQFERSFRSTAADIEKSYAFRNLQSIASPIRSFMANIVKKRILKEMVEQIAASTKVFREERGALIKELKANKDLDQQARKALEMKIQEFNEEHSGEFERARELTADLENQYKTLLEKVEDLIEQKLSYSRISMGTGAPADGNFVDFVLGKFDQNDFNDVFFERVNEALNTVIFPLD